MILKNIQKILIIGRIILRNAGDIVTSPSLITQKLLNEKIFYYCVLKSYLCFEKLTLAIKFWNKK